jgi:hypothetical protein
VANASRKVHLDECSENSHLHWASEVFKLTHDIHALEHKKRNRNESAERARMNCEGHSIKMIKWKAFYVETTRLTTEHSNCANSKTYVRK